MKKTLLIATAFSIFALASCKKNENSSTTTTVTSLNDVKIPSGFNWESSRNLNVSVAVTDTRFGTSAYTISLYDGNPYAGGNLISKGAATATKAFETKIYLATTITQLYVVKTAPDNSTIVEQVAAGNTDISLSIGATDPAYAINSAASSKQVLATAPTSPDCSGGTAITANTNNLNVNSGDTYSITGSNITVGFSNVNGGTIKVCGKNVTLQNLSFNGAATLIVTTSGSINLSSINYNNSSAAIQNFGVINYSGSFPDNGLFANYGSFTCGGDFNLNSNAGTFVNNGTMTVSGSFQDGTSAVATNNGTMVVSGNFQPNSNSAFVNNCSLTVGANYNQSSGVKNYSFINVAGQSIINGGAELGLYNGAMLKTKDFIVDGSAKGYGSTSLIKITGTTNIRNSGSVVANVEVWQTSGSIDGTSAGKVNSGASTTDHSVYIATSGCNSEGNGTAAVSDSDGDGVPDNLDAYPTDPKRAYNVAGATGTIAYEDQWPVKGDFDLNDVVMGYNYTLVTSATNVVVSVSGTFTLYATGGTYSNAFAVEFPVSKSLVSGLAVTKAGVAVSGAAFEAGQTNAVVTLFSNMREEMATWNTRKTEAFTPYKTYTLSFNIANGPTLSTFGQDEYNPFIYNSGRGHEVHVMGKTPTTLADASLFGTNDDNTSVAASRYYVTKAGLPFAINIPAVFAYPSESIDITNAYPHIADWAKSNGSSYTDWYSNLTAGYRNTSNIYTH
ncbi:LruC domain-containing protein [Mucilaginibacter gracilis]|uniref:LruC domain-containing protein n=1 Tax=Mucilaginibacter gracilis TaxID=423350 RepID=A0A495IZW7_9SPHI|nr:LruC domain-containing protein [Mucilaginibacter gracilis]RKR81379.1 LruC domain-containing protein [Mucilaginibacter gracilis]